jgi:GNAT superfamily N-acetyltransferase
MANILAETLTKPSSASPNIHSIFCSTIGSALEHKGVTLYLAYLDSRPVGVLYRFSEGNVGGLYNLGVVHEARKQGVAKTLMLQAIEDWRASGDSILCGQTRADSFQERFYKRLGFEVIAHRNRVIQKGW